MRGAQWDTHPKGRALVKCAFGRNGATVQFHQLQDERQTNSAAFMGAALLPFDAMEAFEQLRLLGLRYADPGIPHGQLGEPINLADSDFDLALEGELERIGQEIE